MIGVPAPGPYHVTSNEFVDVANPTIQGELHIDAGGRLRFACNMAINLSCERLIVHPGGKLEIGATQVGSSIHITTNRIEVHGPSGATPGGAFVVGTETEPARGAVVITLTGNTLTGSQPDRSFVVESGGTLELHGDPRSDTTCWTQLNADAIAGSNSIELVLVANFQWQPGDQIVLASSDFLKVTSKIYGVSDVLGADQSEVFTVMTVNGNVLEVDPPIAHFHCGSIVTGGIDQRAEVGLLTRNVRIEGAPGSSGGFELGGQVLCLQSPGQTTTARVAWTEFTNLGRGPQQAAKDWYPLHFHQMGSVAGSYVKNCSLHDNNRNGLVIHETDDLLADSNVFYNTNGWHVWFQDEHTNSLIRTFSRNNTVTNNLAILAKQDRTIEKNFFSDDRYGDAACFYLRSFDNVVRGNHAVGSQCSGFYVDTQEPWGQFGQWTELHLFKPDPFRDNVSHSNGDHGFYLGGATRFPPGSPVVPPQGGYPTFRNFTAYKNKELLTFLWAVPQRSSAA